MLKIDSQFGQFSLYEDPVDILQKSEFCRRYVKKYISIDHYLQICILIIISSKMCIIYTVAKYCFNRQPTFINIGEPGWLN